MKNIYDSLIPIILINLLCYLSDSTMALSCIESTSKKYELYLDRRILESCKLCNQLNLHRITFESNPGDILSIVCSTSELSKSDF